MKEFPRWFRDLEEHEREARKANMSLIVIRPDDLTQLFEAYRIGLRTLEYCETNLHAFRKEELARGRKVDEVTPIVETLQRALRAIEQMRKE